MPSGYPGALDSFTNPNDAGGDTLASVPHDAQHAAINDAMAAVQATLGINPQGEYETVVERLAAIEAAPGGGGGTKTLARWTAKDGQPPASGFATLDTRNSILVLDFDASATESIVFVDVMPEGANLASGILARLHFMATSATSGAVRLRVEFERCNTDLDSDSFDTATEATVTTSATSGNVTVAEITATNIDSIAAGDLFRCRVSRVANDGVNGTMTGDMELVAVELRQVA